jgi:hypothetical protein
VHAARATTPETPATTTASPSPRRVLSARERALHASFALLLVLVAIGTIAVVIGWVLSQRTPSWWATPDPDDPTLIARAESIERFVSNELSRARPDAQAWRIAIPQEAATAWVNARLPRWLASRNVEWALEGRPILMLFRDGALTVATDLAEPGKAAHRIVGARVAVRIRDDRLVPRLAGVNVGSLVLPPALAAGSIRRALPENAGPEAHEALEALLGATPLGEHAAWRVDESRTVHLIDVEFADDRAILTLVTEADR